MTRRRSALLWGVVGSGVFLVGCQALVLLDAFPLGPVGALAGALAVGGVVAAVSYATEARITRKGRS